LKALWEGVLVHDAVAQSDFRLRAMVLLFTGDYRGLPHVTSMMQSPALNGACIQCKQTGERIEALGTTVYLGAHRWLPADHPTRAMWADSFPRHSLDAKSAAPAKRTHLALSAAARLVEIHERDAKEAGIKGQGKFARALEYVDQVDFYNNDSMHLLSNACMN
jgi:hypothetical protein